MTAATKRLCSSESWSWSVIPPLEASQLCLEHDLVRKPASTPGAHTARRDHALTSRPAQILTYPHRSGFGKAPQGASLPNVLEHDAHAMRAPGVTNGAGWDAMSWERSTCRGQRKSWSSSRPR